MDQWIKRRHSKMGQSAAQALALLGTERALSTLNSVSSLYRAKSKSVEKTAAEAMKRKVDSREV